MKFAILIALVYIIVFALEILVYCISRADAIFIYGFATLIAFVATFGRAVYNEN